MMTTTVSVTGKCLACGQMTEAVAYCVDCVASGQAHYDMADRAGVAVAESVEAFAAWMTAKGIGS